jgi:UDP-4-amino-4,6-dideoxy-N-acetyl-beta-L-altrosamine transaminase
MVTPAFLPYGRQLIEDDDVAAVAAALRADYLTTGPRVEAFERAFAERVGAAHAVACSSGTAALHLSAIALDLGPGDWLVVPSMTFLATANAARFVGAEVQFADVDADTGLITQATLGEALESAKRVGRPVKAVCVVHLAGRTAPMRAIAARAADLPIVEDACHALGTTYEDAGSPARVGDGRHGTLATFSFHPVKTITSGEGGMVTTNDAALAACMRLARNHGMTRDPEALRERAAAMSEEGQINPWYYEMHAPGYNYRLPDILCALGLSQLAKLDRFISRRRALAARYDAALALLAPMVRTIPPVPGCNPALHLYVVLIDFHAIGMDRAQVMRGLRARGIGTQVHYIPVHTQPYYRSRYGDIALPGADAYYRRALSLPLHPSMSDDDVIRVVQALAGVLEGR